MAHTCDPSSQEERARMNVCEADLGCIVNFRLAKDTEQDHISKTISTDAEKAIDKFNIPSQRDPRKEKGRREHIST